MSKFFKSKMFIALVILMLILVIVPTVFASMGITRYLKDAVNTVLTPIQKVFASVTDSFAGYAAYFTEFDRIVEENNQLREENAKLRDSISSAEQTELLNDWLFDYIELKRNHSDYSLCEATVTGRESGNYLTVFTLDKGSSQGIKLNMPVVTKEGVVGYISEVGTVWSKAVTIIESGASVGAYVERSGEIGVVEGNYTLSKEGLCEMKYLSADCDIKEGDRIITSGYGSVYPRGLIIGYVETITENASSRSIDVTIRPTADLTDIQRLMIITSYDVYTE